MKWIALSVFLAALLISGSVVYYAHSTTHKKRCYTVHVAGVQGPYDDKPAPGHDRLVCK